jgi:hypothetical protein
MVVSLCGAKSCSCTSSTATLRWCSRRLQPWQSDRQKDAAAFGSGRLQHWCSDSLWEQDTSSLRGLPAALWFQQQQPSSFQQPQFWVQQLQFWFQQLQVVFGM